MERQLAFLANTRLGGVGFQIDHINRNGLDNRKENLRICSGSQNQMNRGKRIRTVSRYKGVSFDKRRDVWRARIMAYYKEIWIGRYESQLEAAIAYDFVAKQLHGEFACLNFPETK